MVDMNMVFKIKFAIKDNSKMMNDVDRKEWFINRIFYFRYYVLLRDEVIYPVILSQNIVIDYLL